MSKRHPTAHGVNGRSAAPPSDARHLAAIMVRGAVLMPFHQSVRGHRARRRGRPVATRRLLFVCGGNTARSPMAAAIARAELTGDPATRDWRVDSAGVSVRTPGAPLTPEAVAALLDVSVPAPLDHRSRQLTPALCADTDVVYCMTRAQRDEVLTLVPSAAGRTVCLDPYADIADPSGQSFEAHRECAARLHALVCGRLAEFRES